MEVSSSIILALGSNIGRREKNIAKAIQLINRDIGVVLRQAENYENKAQGFDSDTLFLNTCVQIETDLPPLQLLSKLKQIEIEMGRVPKTTSAYTSRPIDIDIIFYADSVICSENLSIPHLLFRTRDFVLLPLLEIAPDWVDPITQLTVGELYNALLGK